MEFLFLNLIILAILTISTAFYAIRMSSMQEEYDMKVANLEQIEQQLMAQEQKLNDMAMAKNSVSMDKSELEQEYASIKEGYESLRIEKTMLLADIDSRPFANTLCKSMGDAKC